MDLAADMVIIIIDAAVSKKNAAVRKSVEIVVVQEMQDMVAAEASEASEAPEDAQTGYSY